MSWKKDFVRNVRFGQLPEIGAFHIASEPEPLGKGKFRCVLIAESGHKYSLSTFEATIGDILFACGDSSCVAFEERVGKEVYIRFKHYNPKEK